MAREYGFTQEERNQYFDPEKVYSSWGRDFNSDFLVLYVYDTSGNLLISKIMGLNEVQLESDGDYVDLNVGQHLRDLGFREGEYDVHYKFLRRLAGRERTVFVDKKGKVFDKNVKRLVIDGEVKYFKDVGDETDKGEREEVFIKEMKYKLVETSPDRSEFILELDEKINNAEYRNEFVEMGQMIEYEPIDKDNKGTIKFDSKDPHVLEFDIDPQDRGFTQNMVGGQIVIPSMYKITGEEDTDNSDVQTEVTLTLQERLESGDATDFLDLSTEDLIDIMLNDPDENERELADGALQERANEQR